MKSAWIVVLLFLQLTPVFAEIPYLQVGKAATRKTLVHFLPIAVSGTRGDLQALANEVHKTVQNDLQFMDLFSFVNDEPTTSQPLDLSIQGEFEGSGNEVKLRGKVLDVLQKKLLHERIYLGSASDIKTVAHSFANDIIEKLTGAQGIFLSKIAMVCDGGGKKELYLMNFDGTETRQITHHRSIVAGPAWHPSGRKIAYSLYVWIKGGMRNQNLYELDLSNGTLRLLTNRTGINSGAAYSPDGRKLALTMSFQGNPEIYLMDPATKSVTQLTHSLGMDVDPTFSPDGEWLLFVSSRSGKPMVFKQNIGTDKAERLTYAGQYNATPSWAARGNKILFAGWVDDRFDIFLMNDDGTKIERLTKAQGNNEDPSFSPDGNFIVFSSNRTGSKNIYVMNLDGTFVRRLTYGLGNCVAPKWSNPKQ